MRSSWLDEATQRLRVDAGQRLANARDRLQVAAKPLDRPPRACVSRWLVGDDQAEFVAQHAVDGRHAAAEEALIGGRLADLAADLGNQRQQHVDRDRLAVDQHAVAIEDDQFGAMLQSTGRTAFTAMAGTAEPSIETHPTSPGVPSGQSAPER